MAAIRNLDGSVAQFVVTDGQGNESVGHFELTIVPSFAPGTRCGDLTFFMDEQRRASQTPQSPGELLIQAPTQRLMS